MLQPYVLPSPCSDNTGYRERDFSERKTIEEKTRKSPNLLALAEGEGGTATRLGRKEDDYHGEIKDGIIHRVPSVEGGTATRLGSFILDDRCKKIYIKNAPVV